MAIQHLTAIVPPPAHPMEAGDLASFSDVEKQLGLRLPSDYREFCMQYGTGTFNDPGRLCIFVRNAFATDFVETLRNDCAYVMEAPYAVYPDTPGLLPWGSDDSDTVLYWLTEGAPEDWPTIFYDGCDYQRSDLPMTLFLAQAFSRTLAPTPWTEPVFFSGPRRVKFAATQDEIQ